MEIEFSKELQALLKKKDKMILDEQAKTKKEVAEQLRKNPKWDPITGKTKE
jgi:phage terminase small subunit